MFVLTIEDEHVFVTDVSIIIRIVLKIIISTVFVNLRKKLFLFFKNLKTNSRTIYKLNLQALIFNKKTFVNHVKQSFVSVLMKVVFVKIRAKIINLTCKH